MSSTVMRIVAAVAAVVIAVLTGTATGLIAPSQTCVTASRPVTASPTVTTTDTGGGSDIGALAPGTNNNHKPTAPQNQAAPARTCTGGGFAVLPALVAFLGTAFLGGVMLLVLLLSGRTRRPAPAAVAPRSAPPADSTASRAESERSALIQAIIYVRDRVTSKALADRLGAALRDVGVDSVDPVGARFDPAHHEAGGAAPADDPARVGSIAAVEVSGYADRGRLLRAPVVTVYQSADRTRGEQR